MSVNLEEFLGEGPADAFGFAFLGTYGDNLGWALRIPRDLVLAVWDTIDFISDLQYAIQVISTQIQDAINLSGENEDSRESFARALVDLCAIQYKNGCNSAESTACRSSLYNCVEYLEAVSEAPISFCGKHYTSFYSLSVDSIDIHSTIDDFLRLGDRGWTINYGKNDPWEKYPTYPDDWYKTKEGQDARSEYFNLTYSQFDELQGAIRGELSVTPKDELELWAKKFRKAGKELSTAHPTIVNQMFRAWKTLSWPDGYETLSSHPLTQKEKKQLSPNGRPPKYNALLKKFKKGNWKDESEYYYDLCTSDDPDVKNHRGKLISFRAFKKGLNDARKRTKPTE